jgi:hypothetical protein
MIMILRILLGELNSQMIKVEICIECTDFKNCFETSYNKLVRDADYKT